MSDKDKKDNEQKIEDEKVKITDEFQKK